MCNISFFRNYDPSCGFFLERTLEWEKLKQTHNSFAIKNPKTGRKVRIKGKMQGGQHEW
jgi:hypothetical protein